MQHGPIACSAAGVGIRRIEHCLHFCVCKIVDECLIRSFDRDGFDATDLIEAAGQAILQEAKEGFDGAEPGISSLRQIMTLRLDVFEEREDQRGIELLDLQREGATRNRLAAKHTNSWKA